MKYSFHILAFVVMPDHIHPLLWWDADIHANPVRAGLAASPGTYPWSSAANYGVAFAYPHPVQITLYAEIL